MRCRIANFRTPQKQPVPEAVSVGVYWEIDIDNLFDFAAKYKVMVQLRSPGMGPPAAEGNWFLWISKDGFGQR